MSNPSRSVFTLAESSDPSIVASTQSALQTVISQSATLMTSPFAIAEEGLSESLVKEFEPEIEMDDKHLLKTLLDQVPSAIAMLDGKMRYLFANQQWIEDFKLQSDTCIGRSHYELFPKLHPGWKQVYERALAGQVVKCDREESSIHGISVLSRWEIAPWYDQKQQIGGITIRCSRVTPSLISAEQRNEASKIVWSRMWDGPLPMLALNAQGQILRCSSAAASLLLPHGYREGQSTLWDVLGEAHEGGDLRTKILQALHSVLQDQEPLCVVQTGTLPVSMADVPSVWLFSRLNAEDGDLPALVWVLGFTTLPELSLKPSLSLGTKLPNLSQSLPQLKQQLQDAVDSEKRAMQRETRLRSILEYLPQGLLVLDEKAQLIFQNSRITHLLGRGIALGGSCENWLLKGSDSEAAQEEIRHVWRNEIWRKQTQQIFKVVREDGETVDLDLKPVMLPGGGLLILVNDITDLRKRQEVLSAAELKFRTLLQESPWPMLVTDLQGEILEVNPLAEAWLQHSRAELRHSALRTWLPETAFSAELVGLYHGNVDKIEGYVHLPGQAVAFIKAVATRGTTPSKEFVLYFVQPQAAPPAQQNATTAIEQATSFDVALMADSLMEQPILTGEDFLCLDDEALSADHFDLTAAFESEWTQAPVLNLQNEGSPALIQEPLDGQNFGLATNPLKDASLLQERLEPTHLRQQRLVIGETHQRVCDHLQVLTSMLNLQMTTLRNEEAKQALRTSQNRIGAMASLHLYLSKLTSGDPDDFTQVVEQMIRSLRDSYDIEQGRVIISLDLTQKVLKEEWTMPLALALQEMLSNAFRHAFDEDQFGSIYVQLDWDDARGFLRVMDDGKGIPEDLQDRYVEGMGLKILRVFAGQLGGELTFKRAETEGSIFELNFPVNSQV